MKLRDILNARVIALAGKGATAYELELGVEGWRSVYVRWVFLVGGRWRLIGGDHRFSARIVNYEGEDAT